MIRVRRWPGKIDTEWWLFASAGFIVWVILWVVCKLVYNFSDTLAFSEEMDADLINKLSTAQIQGAAYGTIKY